MFATVQFACREQDEFECQQGEYAAGHPRRIVERQ